MARLRSVKSLAAAALALATAATAQIAPSNATLPQLPSALQIYLHYAGNSTDGPIPTYSIDVAGIYQPTGFNVSNNMNISGPVMAFTSDVEKAVVGQIVLLSCDNESYYQNTMVSGAAGFVSLAESKIYGSAGDVGAIILYSRYSTWCEWNGTTNGPIFTTTSAGEAQALLGILNTPFLANETGWIGAAQLTGAGAPSSSSGYSGTPSTTIAMIALYSVTGIITFLFLLVVLLGAIRAQRHPERYGPRNILGMPRQSKARGMARAMLDTIPIVKFGENNEQDKATERSASQDVELADRDPAPSAAKEAEANTAQNAAATATSSNPAASNTPAASTAEPEAASGVHVDKELKATDMPLGDSPAEVPGASTVQIEPATAPTPDDAQEGTVSCPICTEDFVRGEEARLLPCHHHFHPACIDPWLLNVSSTCPMCRIDLNPQSGEEGEEGENGASSNSQTSRQQAGDVPQWPYTRRATNTRQWPYDQSQGAGTSRGRHGFFSSGFGILNLTHMSQANPEERIHALRQFRAARQAREQGRTRARQGTEPSSDTNRLSRIGRIFHRQGTGEQSQTPAPAQNQAISETAQPSSRQARRRDGESERQA